MSDDVAGHVRQVPCDAAAPQGGDGGGGGGGGGGGASGTSQLPAAFHMLSVDKETRGMGSSPRYATADL